MNYMKNYPGLPKSRGTCLPVHIYLQVIAIEPGVVQNSPQKPDSGHFPMRGCRFILRSSTYRAHHPSELAAQNIILYLMCVRIDV